MSYENPNAVPNTATREMPVITSFPPPLANCSLTPTEQRVYLQLSLEFSLILEDAPSFQMGAYEWNLVLPNRLQTFALTVESWERLSTIGDGDEGLQNQLATLIEQFS